LPILLLLLLFLQELWGCNSNRHSRPEFTPYMRKYASTEGGNGNWKFDFVGMALLAR
jgi:hypothetical protein